MDNNKDIWRPVPAASLAIRHGDTTAMLSIEDQLDGVLFEVETHTVACGVESHSELVVHVTSTADLKLLSMQLSEMYQRRVAREDAEEAAKPLLRAFHPMTRDNRLIVQTEDGRTVTLTEPTLTRSEESVVVTLRHAGYEVVGPIEQRLSDGEPVYPVKEK